MRAFELIAEARDLANDPAGDLYTDAKMLRHLNRALRDVTSRSRSIREVIYNPVNKGQSVYGLPEGFLGNDKFSWLYKGYWYPLLRRSLSVVEYINNSNIITSWRPFYFDVWGKVREEKVVANVEAVSDDGGIFEPHQDIYTPYPPTTVEYYGFKFEDGIRGLDDIRIGDLIINMTDGAEGHVRNTKFLGNGLLLISYNRLENGRRAGTDFGKIMVDDFIRITTPNVVSHALRISPVPTETSEPGEETLWMYLSRRHYVVQQDNIDNFNDGLEIDIELETPTLERILYWMRREELGASDPETQAQKQEYENEYHRALPKIRQRNRDHESTWGEPQSLSSRQNIGLEGINTPSAHPFNTHNVR